MSVVKFVYKLLSKVLRHFLRVEGEWVDYKQITVATVTQIGAVATTLDKRYKVLTLDKWKEIIKTDTLNETKKWKKDVFDCDNFALVFSAHCAEFHEVNSAGIAVGTIYDANTLNKIGKHAYNILAVKEGDQLVLYLYEPQTDGLTVASKKTKLGNWVYETEVVVFG